MCGKKNNIACRQEMNAQAKVIKKISPKIVKTVFLPVHLEWLPYKWTDSTKIMWKAEKQQYIESKDVNYCLG